jgi:uncharacterized membrane protein YgcG
MQQHLRNMFKTRINTWISALAIVLAVTVGVSLAIPAQAQTKEKTPANQNANMRLDSFSADIVVNQDSTFDVTETIKGEFLRERHGIFRFIPTSYERDGFGKKRIGLDVEEVTLNGDSVMRDIYREGNSKVVKIGDPDVTFSGPFTYTISYQVDGALFTFEDKDRREVYWNVTGTEWPVAIPDVQATVKVDDVSADAFEAACYTGKFGSTKQECEKNVSDGDVTFTAESFMTVAVSFPAEHITGPSAFQTLAWWLRDNWDYFAFIVPIVVGVVLYRRWSATGRDPEEKNVVAPSFEPPEELEPVEVGALLDVKADDRDFSAVLIGLAVKGYLKIRETESGLFSSKSYELEALKSADDGLSEYEREVYQALFEDGDEVELKDRREELVKARKKVKKSVFERLAENGYFVKNPRKVQGIYLVSAFFIGFAAFPLGFMTISNMRRPTVLIAGILTALMVGIVGMYMPKKTEKGAEAYEKARGFKLFLSKAEKYRIEWQEKEGIFAEFLPYAMAFEVADKWAQVFDVEEVKEATGNWYVPAAGFTSVTDMTDNLDSFAGTAASMSTPSSSGSSGGGSVGGGVGGGGGGSW